MPENSVIDQVIGAHALQRRSHGVIETSDEQLVSLRLRAYPKLISLPKAIWWGSRVHAHRPGNRCLLYFNQPWGCPDYLTLQYVISRRDTTLATFRLALYVLDRIAEQRHTHAIVADVTNQRISDRCLRRMGWEPHLERSKRRHWIKRFPAAYASTVAAATMPADGTPVEAAIGVA